MTPRDAARRHGWPDTEEVAGWLAAGIRFAMKAPGDEAREAAIDFVTSAAELVEERTGLQPGFAVGPHQTDADHLLVTPTGEPVSKPEPVKHAESGSIADVDLTTATRDERASAVVDDLVDVLLPPRSLPILADVLIEELGRVARMLDEEAGTRESDVIVEDVLEAADAIGVIADALRRLEPVGNPGARTRAGRRWYRES